MEWIDVQFFIVVVVVIIINNILLTMYCLSPVIVRKFLTR